MSVRMQTNVYVDLINCIQGEVGMAVLLNEMQYIVLYNIMLMYIIPARSTTTVRINFLDTQSMHDSCWYTHNLNRNIVCVLFEKRAL